MIPMEWKLVKLDGKCSISYSGHAMKICTVMSKRDRFVSPKAFFELFQLQNVREMVYYMKYVFQTLGKVGKVMQIYMDGDVRVQTYSCEQSRVQSWTFNPLCLVNVSGSTESHNFAGTNQNRESKYKKV